MKVKKARVQVGYSRSGLGEYRTRRFDHLVGADVVFIDGLGNNIQVNIREGDIGTRIVINGKEILNLPEQSCSDPLVILPNGEKVRVI